MINGLAMPPPPAEPSVSDTILYIKRRNRAPATIAKYIDSEPSLAEALHDELIAFYADYHTGLTEAQFTSVFMLDLTHHQQATGIVLQ